MVNAPGQQVPSFLEPFVDETVIRNDIVECVIDQGISCHCHQPIRLSTGRQTSEPSIANYKILGKESRDGGFCVGVVAHDLAPFVGGYSSLRVALHEAVHRCL